MSAREDMTNSSEVWSRFSPRPFLCGVQITASVYGRPCVRNLFRTKRSRQAGSAGWLARWGELEDRGNGGWLRDGVGGGSPWRTLLGAKHKEGQYCGESASNATRSPGGAHDHLDRTERLLVQVEHSESRDATENAQLQSEAQELLASNRLYRVTASNTSDAALAGALDRLEGVLAEIANNPNLTAGDLKRVRNDMNTRGNSV